MASWMITYLGDGVRTIQGVGNFQRYTTASVAESVATGLQGQKDWRVVAPGKVAPGKKPMAVTAPVPAPAVQPPPSPAPAPAAAPVSAAAPAPAAFHDEDTLDESTTTEPLEDAEGDKGKGKKARAGKQKEDAKPGKH